MRYWYIQPQRTHIWGIRLLPDAVKLIVLQYVQISMLIINAVSWSFFSNTK